MKQMSKPAALVAALFTLAGADVAPAADHAAIIMYHRFGEDRIPSTNIRLAQLEAHIAELKSGGYTVLPLKEIARRFEAREALPDRAIAITVDDAYKSFLNEGWPRFNAAGLPVTLFVAAESADSRVKGYLDWKDLRQLKSEGVEIGHHSYMHQHMPAWDMARNRADLNRASERFAAELGQKPELFAYPYGEWSADTIRLLKELGFRIAFGQHSGTAHARHDPYWQPRFPLNETYGDIVRFRQVVNALPFPVSNLDPADQLLDARQNPPRLSFDVPEDVGDLRSLSCYASHREGLLKPSQPAPRRIEINAVDKFPPGRGRISCTLQASGADKGRLRWFGIQFFIPQG